MALIIENKYHKILPSFIVQPYSTKSRLTVEISPFSWDPLEALSSKIYSDQLIFRRNTGVKSHKIYISHIPGFVYSICIQDPNIPAVLSFS